MIELMIYSGLHRLSAGIQASELITSLSSFLIEYVYLIVLSESALLLCRLFSNNVSDDNSCLDLQSQQLVHDQEKGFSMVALLSVLLKPHAL